jgi:hypothetical protein
MGLHYSSDLIGHLFNRTDELIQNVAAKYFPFLQGNSNTIIKNTVEVSPWGCVTCIFLIIFVCDVGEITRNAWVKHNNSIPLIKMNVIIFFS